MEQERYKPIYSVCCHQLELTLVPSDNESYQIRSASGKLVAMISPPYLSTIDGFNIDLNQLDPSFSEEITRLKEDLFNKLEAWIN